MFARITFVTIVQVLFCVEMTGGTRYGLMNTMKRSSSYHQAEADVAHLHRDDQSDVKGNQPTMKDTNPSSDGGDEGSEIEEMLEDLKEEYDSGGFRDILPDDSGEGNGENAAEEAEINQQAETTSGVASRRSVKNTLLRRQLGRAALDLTLRRSSGGAGGVFGNKNNGGAGGLFMPKRKSKDDRMVRPRLLFDRTKDRNRMLANEPKVSGNPDDAKLPYNHIEIEGQFNLTYATDGLNNVNVVYEEALLWVEGTCKVLFRMLGLHCHPVLLELEGEQLAFKLHLATVQSFTVQILEEFIAQLSILLEPAMQIRVANNIGLVECAATGGQCLRNSQMCPADADYKGLCDARTICCKRNR